MPRAKKRLLDLGQITPDGNVVCTLKEYNQHRHDLYNAAINRASDERVFFIQFDSHLNCPQNWHIGYRMYP